MTLAAIEHPDVTRVKAGPAEIDGLIEARRHMVAMGDYSLDLSRHGTLSLIFFQAKLRRGEDRATSHKGVVNFMSEGPRVAFSRDHLHLLVRDRINLELPALPSSDGKKGYLLDEGGAVIHRPQRWEDLGAVIMEGTHGDLLVCQNVHQIVFRGHGAYVNVECRPGRFGDCCAFVVDFGRQEAYFLGGDLISDLK